MAASPTGRTLVAPLASLVWLLSASSVSAQQTSVAPTVLTPVPRVVWFSGTFRPADGQPVAAVETMTLAVYADQQGGTPLWQETHAVVMGNDGKYNVLLGSTTADGLPLDLFTTGEPRWLGVRVDRAAETEQPRALLASVPYALKAADAETLGGKPASAYQLAPPQGSGAAGTVKASTAAGDTATPQANSGIANRIGKFVNAIDLDSSQIFQAGSSIGVMGAGVAAPFTPLDVMHVAFNNGIGSMTGYAVQNTSATPTAYSGMLFYDQNGALGQFQGFNNSTHEYRINNIAAGGTINFMIGSASKFQVANNGNVTVANNMSVNGNIAAKYQDVAEWVETTEPLEPGMVVIVDPSEPNRVLAAPKAYDTRVAGAVSRQPGLVLGEKSDSKAMVAQSGRVKVKADARYGAIKIGDLLVTSPTPGHAMRSRPVRVGSERMHRPGTLLGKALEALPSGKGEILVLLTLQ
jgi:hypothetical protein